MNEAKKRRRKSQQQEKQIAKELGGQVVPGSGAFPGMKSDVVADEYGFRIEAKYTDNKSYSVTRQVIEKIRREALASGNNWLLQVDINGGGPPRRLAILDYHVLRQMMETCHDRQAETADTPGSESD